MSSRVVVLFNPASGRGKAERFACALTASLRADGWTVDPRSIHDPDADTSFGGARAVVVIGGDGTVHRAAPKIARAGVPMCIAPMGTENLLAKELSMSTDIDDLRGLIRHGASTEIDLPIINGVSFLVMCSIGLDAAIVHAVEANRTGKIRKSAYLRPTLEQVRRPILPALRVVVNGEPVIGGQRGMLVVANCRRYGGRLNPAPNASMTDGLLDVAFYPMHNALDAIRWAALSRLGQHETARGFIKSRGSRIEVTSVDESAPPVQIDGEPAPREIAFPLRFTANDATITILQHVHEHD